MVYFDVCIIDFVCLCDIQGSDNCSLCSITYALLYETVISWNDSQYSCCSQVHMVNS